MTEQQVEVRKERAEKGTLIVSKICHTASLPASLF